MLCALSWACLCAPWLAEAETVEFMCIYNFCLFVSLFSSESTDLGRTLMKSAYALWTKRAAILDFFAAQAL